MYEAQMFIEDEISLIAIDEQDFEYMKFFKNCLKTFVQRPYDQLEREWEQNMEKFWRHAQKHGDGSKKQEAIHQETALCLKCAYNAAMMMKNEQSPMTYENAIRYFEEQWNRKNKESNNKRAETVMSEEYWYTVETGDAFLLSRISEISPDAWVDAMYLKEEFAVIINKNTRNAQEVIRLLMDYPELPKSRIAEIAEVHPGSVSHILKRMRTDLEKVCREYHYLK